MAENDIRVWNSPHGGHPRIQHFELDAGESFLKGEPVRLSADGLLEEAADDPTAAGLFGIAAGGGDTTAGTGTRDWRTDAVIASGATVPVICPDPTTYFITSNFGSTSEAFAEAPAQTDIGDEAGLELVSGAWGINTGATNNTCRIIDVLNADYNSIQGANPVGGTTGVHVVFVITQHQAMHVTAPEAGT